jgi:hypothetical protein
MNKTLAQFTFHEIHTVTFTRTPDGHTATCETCSLPAAIAAAVAFMYGNNVHRLTVDGAPLNRI